MNSLSSLPPPLLAPASLPGRSTLDATAALGAARQPASWLDAGQHHASEPLHVGPNSHPRAIDDIERDFMQALCAAGPDAPT